MKRSRDPRQETTSSVPMIDGKSMNAAIAERVLVARSKAGDHAAFVELIQKGSPLARRAIRSIAFNPADVDDVMQDTLMDAFKGVRSFNGRSKFSTWLTRIAINNALMLLRRRRNRIEISFDADVEATHDGFLQLADNTISPEQFLIREEFIQSIRRAVRALPPTLRAYAELRCLKELPHSEVASALGISLGAGKARSFQARQQLKRSLISLRDRAA
jgi:RNA polymerase sigma-70 factor (ECF subfamily)